MTRTDTKKRVATLLVNSGPMTARDIAKLTGHSYNTVRNALTNLGAVSDGGFPAEYSLATSDDIDTLLSTNPSLATSEKVLLIDHEEREAWVEDWNRSIPKVAKLVEKLQLYPADDPAILRDQLLKIIVPMAGLAYQLNMHADDPDWYSAIGGADPTE